jgi:hypothetical protein
MCEVSNTDGLELQNPLLKGFVHHFCRRLLVNKHYFPVFDIAGELLFLDPCLSLGANEDSLVRSLTCLDFTEVLHRLMGSIVFEIMGRLSDGHLKRKDLTVRVKVETIESWEVPRDRP